MKVLIASLIDVSGSMSGKEADVIGGVNSFLEAQKEVPGEAYITLVKFDHEYIPIYSKVDLKEARSINSSDYMPRGNTALLDAMGRLIHELDHQMAETGAERVILTVTTDGFENASKEFTKAKIKDMVATREATKKWTFLYFGADPSAFSEATSMGFSVDNTVQYQNTNRGTHDAYATMNCSVTNLRNYGSITPSTVDSVKSSSV